MALHCPHCGADLYPGANHCIRCGEEVDQDALEAIASKSSEEPTFQQPVSGEKIREGKPKKKHKALGIILLVFGILIVIGAISSSTDSNKPQKVGDIEEVTKTASEPKVTEESTKTAFEVGEIAEYHSIQMTVLGYEISEGGKFSEPESGNEFVFINIEIVNNSEKEVKISSMMSFDAYCDDYKLDYSSKALFALDGKKQLDGSIAPGKRMNGYLGVEVPKDWGTIELFFTDSIWSNAKMHFEISK